MNVGSSLLEVCRICLATDDEVTLYCLQYGHLKLYMDTVLSINDDSHIEGLPQFVCYECGIHLRKCYNIIKKINMAQTILHRIFAENGEITKSLVKNLNRENLELKSTMESHNIMPSYLFNYKFNYQQNLSYLTSIEYLYDVNETTIELDKNSDTISIQSDHNEDVIENVVQDVKCMNSTNENILFFEDETNINEECNIVHINHDINSTGLSEKSTDENRVIVFGYTKNDNDDNDSAGVSYTSTEENSENVFKSSDKLVQTSDVKSKTKITRSRNQSDKSESKDKREKRKSPHETRDSALEKYFNIVVFKSLQEKIDEWHKSMENPSWIRHKEPVNKLYKCEICSKMFANLQPHQQHIKLHEPISGNHECPVCKIRHKDKKGAKTHMNTVHCKKYYCKSCPKSFSNRIAAENHHALHMGHLYKCGQCSFACRHPSGLSKHKLDKHTQAFACELCGRTCVNLFGLQQHRDKQHRGETVPETNKKYSCEQCNFSFTNEEALRVHLLTSVQHKELKNDLSMENTCQYCGKKFASRSQLQVHKRSDHDNVMKSTRRYQKSIEYPKTCEHSTEYPKTCEHCDVVLQTARQHYSHMRREHPLKRYQGVVFAVCEICGLGFKNEGLLKYHKLRHNSPKVPCPSCKKLFHYKTQMKVHQAKVHNAEKPYVCHTCGAGFYSPSNLIRHKTIHTDLTPYECSLCGKQVKHKSSLRLHIRTVHRKMPYPSVVNRKKRTRKCNPDDNSDKDDDSK